MAALAALLQQRLHVFMERGGIRRSEGSSGKRSKSCDAVKRGHAFSNGQS
jgi:hypothetical protein